MVRKFTMVMGTGIVANAGAVLGVPAALDARLVWLLAAVLLVVLLVTTRDWGLTPFLGAPAMALLTVGLHVPAALGRRHRPRPRQRARGPAVPSGSARWRCCPSYRRW